MKNNHLLMKFTIVFALLIAFSFSACEEETLDTCATNFTSVDVSPKTIMAGEDFVVEVEFLETIGLEDFQAREIVNIFLSEDNALDSGDQNVTSFNEITRNGDLVNLVFQEITIDFSQPSGDYFLIIQLEEQVCNGGEKSDEDIEAIAVTIN